MTDNALALPNVPAVPVLHDDIRDGVAGRLQAEGWTVATEKVILPSRGTTFKPRTRDTFGARAVLDVYATKDGVIRVIEAKTRRLDALAGVKQLRYYAAALGGEPASLELILVAPDDVLEALRSGDRAQSVTLWPVDAHCWAWAHVYRIRKGWAMWPLTRALGKATEDQARWFAAAGWGEPYPYPVWL